MATSGREQRGLTIANMEGQINRINDHTYKVKSQSDNGWYLVKRDGLEWVCECPDHVNRRVVCKHIYSVQFSLVLRRKISTENIGLVESIELGRVCKRCGSTQVIKQGVRKNKNGNSQRYKCKRCGHKFVERVSGFHKMKNKPQIITLDLYFKGISYRKIVDHLKQFHGLEVSHVAIIKWVKKYTKLIKEYVDSLMPQTSGLWHTDEMAVKVAGDYKWLWNVMDHETRFLLASQISQKRMVEDARTVFQSARGVAKADPKIMVTDGLPAYIKAFKKEFFTLKGPRAKHIRKPHFTDPTNTNMVERMQGSIREREKVMRSIKIEDSDVVEGYRIYYNFIRPHMSLDGKTPAEVAGLDLGLEGDRWLSLIKQSAEDKEIPKVSARKILTVYPTKCVRG